MTDSEFPNPKEDTTPDTLDDELGVIGINELQDFVSNVVRKVGFEDTYQSTREQTFDEAFALGEGDIREIDSFVRSRLSEIQGAEEQSINFKGKVGFADRSQATYTDLGELFVRADEEEPPDFIYLQWAVLLPDLLAAKIEVVFDAKKAEEKKKKSELLMDPGPNSVVKYKVSGREDNRDWVERTGSLLTQKVEGTFLNQFYFRFLKIFRSNALVNGVSWIMAWMGFIISIGLLDRVYESGNYGGKAEVRRSISSTDSAAGKIDILSQYLLREENIIFEPLFELGGAAFIFICILVGGRMLLPKLAPKSGILIGSYESKWQDYQNLARFIIVVGLFGSIISYVIGTMLDALFNIF